LLILEIIIGLQRYGFSQNWQTFSLFFKEADYQSQAMLGHKTSNVPMQKIACFASEQSIEKNIHLPMLDNKDNVLEFEMGEGGLMHLKYFISKDLNFREYRRDRYPLSGFIFPTI